MTHTYPTRRSSDLRAVEIGRHAGPEGREIGAHIRLGRDLEREELAVLVERQLGVGDVIAAMRVGHEGFAALRRPLDRSEEHTSELQSLMRISYAVLCLTKKTRQTTAHIST